MRIAIDGRTLTGRFTGDRTYWKNLLSALARIDTVNEYRIYARVPIPLEELPAAANFTGVVVPGRNDRLWTLWNLPMAMRRDEIKLLHVQYTLPPKLLLPCPVVTTIHDISFRLHPEWFPFRHRLILNLTTPAALRGAARVFTVSESSRHDILQAYSAPAERVVATCLGLPEEIRAAVSTKSPVTSDHSERLKERYRIHGDYLLTVGVLQPRKNLPLLAEAFGLARQKAGLKHQLVIVGKIGWDTGQELLRKRASLHGGSEAAEALIFPGYVEDADLPALYRGCSAFAYPSLYEGFGLPPLEAMACGAPTLVSDRPALPEVVGDAAMILPAEDANAWAQGIIQVLTDASLRERLSACGQIHALNCGWEPMARKTLQAYQEAVTEYRKRL